MSRKHKDSMDGLNFQDLQKRLKSDIGDIKETFKDIEELLREATRSLKQVIGNEITNQELFFNVAPPAVPPNTPPAVTPVSIVQIITNDIARIARQIRNNRIELRQLIISSIVTLRALALAQRQGNEEVAGLAVVNFFTIVSQIERIQRENQALRDELEADVILLLGIAGEL
jgi:hypothetical protein